MEIDVRILLEDFLRYIKEAHMDRYGHLEIVEDGDELDPTYERVIEQFLEKRRI